MPAVVSYVYYHQDIHGRLVRSAKPSEDVQTRILDLGGGNLVEELRVMSRRPSVRAVLSADGPNGERWVEHENPDDHEWTFWRRPYRERGVS